MPPFRPSAAPKVWVLGQGLPPPGRFIALVPGEAAPIFPVALPPGLRGAARLAVAQRQARDRLGTAAPPLDLRPAPLGTSADGWSSMLAADPVDLDRWRHMLGSALGSAQGRVLAVIPDYLALLQAPGLWVMAADDAGRIRARLGPADGFAAEADLAALMLAQARGRGPVPRAVLLTEGALPFAVAQALDGLEMVTDPARLPSGVPAPRALALGELALDLRRDTASRIRQMAARIAAARLPLALLALGLAGWAGSVMQETTQLREQVAALDAANLATVRRDLVPDGPLLDIRLQVARALAQRQTAAEGALQAADRVGVLEVLHRAAQGLASVDATPRALSIQDGGEGQLDLIVPDFAFRDRVVAGLRAAGLMVSVTRSGTAEGGVAVGLTLSPAAGDAP